MITLYYVVVTNPTKLAGGPVRLTQKFYHPGTVQAFRRGGARGGELMLPPFRSLIAACLSACK